MGSLVHCFALIVVLRANVIRIGNSYFDNAGSKTTISAKKVYLWNVFWIYLKKWIDNSVTFYIRHFAKIFFCSVFSTRKPEISFPPELRKRIKRDLELDYGKDNVCSCSITAENCSEDSNCENRSAQIECGSDCKVKDCHNRKFTKRIYPPLHKFKTWWGGFGLEAKQKISG